MPSASQPVNRPTQWRPWGLCSGGLDGLPPAPVLFPLELRRRAVVAGDSANPPTSDRGLLSAPSASRAGARGTSSTEATPATASA
jgi:hypothetical protein